MKKSLLFILAMMFALAGNASTVDDVINQTLTGVTGTSYADFTCTGTSGTQYSGRCAGAYSSVQLRTSGSSEGVVSTSSIGYVRKFAVTWNENTSTNRFVDVYGSNTAYTAASDLYSEDTQGVLLGSLEYGSDITSFEISGDYMYIGFRSRSNALYLDDITVTWETVDDTYVAQPTITPSSGTYYEAQTVTMTASDGCTIFYTVNNGEEQTYSAAFTLEDVGTYTIAAYAKDGNGNKSTTNTVEITIEAPISSCAGLRAACDEGGGTSTSTAVTAVYKFADLLVTGVNGSLVFVADDGAAFLLYGSNSGLTKGDKISGTIEGKLYTYNGLREMTVSDWSGVTIGSQGNAVGAAVAEIGDVVGNYDTYEAAYVEFEKVSVQSTAVDGKYLGIEDAGGDDINIYDTANVLTNETYSTEASYNVYAYVTRYNATVQVYVLTADDIQMITDKEIPEAAWSASSETVYVGETAEAAFSTNSDGNVTYSSDNEAVAAVSQEGVITGVAAGTATVTATVAATDIYETVAKSITITVREKLGGLETFTNGGFEEWTDDNTPVGWVPTTTASNCTVTKSEDAYEGNYSVQIPHGSSNNRMGSKEFLLPAGTYTVTFYAKSADADNLAKVRGGYTIVDEDGTINSSSGYVYVTLATDVPAEWTETKFAFTLEEETTTNLIVMNQSGGAGALLVDDYSIVEGDNTGGGGDDNNNDDVTLGGLETFENGGFEEWTDDITPVGWVSTNSVSSSGKVSKSTDAYEGIYSAEIAHSSSSNYRLGSKEFLLPAGTYTISFYAKPATDDLVLMAFGYVTTIDGSLSYNYNYDYYDADGTVLPTGEWTHVEETFTLDEETEVNFMVMNGKSGASALLIDNYSIVEGTDDPTGITTVERASSTSDVYNLGGQKVTDSYRGIVISGGKKYLKK